MKKSDKADNGGGRGKSEIKREKVQTWIPKIVKKRVCTTFVEDASSNGVLCQCGHVRNVHNVLEPRDSGDGGGAAEWDSSQHTTECTTDAFGELEFAGAARRHSYFLRLSCDTQPEIIYNLMTTYWALPSPNLVVSVVGGEGCENIATWLREVLRNGLVRAAQSTGAWILTGGIWEGVARCVGEAVRDHDAAAPALSKNKVIAVGLAPWGVVHNRQQLVNAQGSFPARYYVQNTSHDTCCLDNNCQAFLLVDDGSTGRRGGETAFRANLEDYISHQRTGIWGSGSIEIPVLCMLISGDARMLERVDTSLKRSTPWLVLSGTGPAADFISELLLSLACSSVSQTCPSTMCEIAEYLSDIRELVRDKVNRYFQGEDDLEKLVDCALSIYQNRELITVFHGQQEGLYDFDTVLLKALVRASKRLSSDASQYTQELKLAVAWNRVDIAKAELFAGNIQWTYEDLDDSMTDALINDKPQFVRLFCENGLNIVDYLTYERLESLYRSFSDSTVVYTLLREHLSDRLSLSASLASLNADKAGRTAAPWPASAQELSLFEVSCVLWDLLGDVCQPFYYEVLGLDPESSLRNALRQVIKLLQGKCAYRDKHCQSPWAALFIWAVLQNRSEMAIYFWEMAGESVLSALGGCKLLREISQLESETESKVAVKELAQKFEDLAHDVFGECYQSSERRSFNLLIRKSPRWPGTTCLQMATAADARHFFSHDGVQALLSQIWWGSMDRSTHVWKLVSCFFVPPLIYTDLIAFRKDEEDAGGAEVRHVETDNRDANDATVLPLEDMIHNDGHAEEVRALTEEVKASSASKMRRPFIVSQWRKFWFAPVTSFLGNVLMYFLFLVLFAYVLLVDFKSPSQGGPSKLEFLLYFWVFTLACEEFRQSFFMPNNLLLQRLKTYIQDKWNKCDLTAIVIFICALCCRMFPWSFKFGRALMAVDYIVFTMRLIHIFAVHKQLGPKIIIVGKMMKDIFFFLFFLAVWLVAYGVANQALLYSYDPRPDWIFRRVLHKPYMHIYGLLPMEEVDDELFQEINCTDNRTLIQAGAEPCMNTYANWLVILLQTVYLLVTNILLINLLIAMFSYTFNKVQDHSDTYWKFQRYSLIVEYHSRPCLAPPFIIISHLNVFIKRYIRRIPSEKRKHFVLELQGVKASRLNMWEAIQKEDLLSAQNKRQRESDTERLKRTSIKVDSMLKRMAENRDHDRRLQLLETEMEFCCNALSWMMEAMSQSNLIATDRTPPILRDLSPS
ncbi:transient receptor potential cation channel subfamily M member 4a isoform X1 [Hippocampus comes]|uniref:transient receptor potential cation channel subfamily M member 4a isoform X1 n=1 Tax=Hippocampus comes TaxID=109280 RepID=UPI00094E3338|nr:PREDICTED: transient receptor potential cation channel subfamily M member 4-like isoform X1 [Hippocampus comes]